MDQNLRELAHRVLNKEDFQDYMSYAKDNPGGLLYVAQTARDAAVEELLKTVYRDECDFVIMGHYRMAEDLLQATKLIVDDWGSQS